MTKLLVQVGDIVEARHSKRKGRLAKVIHVADDFVTLETIRNADNATVDTIGKVTDIKVSRFDKDYSKHVPAYNINVNVYGGSEDPVAQVEEAFERGREAVEDMADSLHEMARQSYDEFASHYPRTHMYYGDGATTFRFDPETRNGVPLDQLSYDELMDIQPKDDGLKEWERELLGLNDETEVEVPGADWNPVYDEDTDTEYYGIPEDDDYEEDLTDDEAKELEEALATVGYHRVPESDEIVDSLDDLGINWRETLDAEDIVALTIRYITEL